MTRIQKKTSFIVQSHCTHLFYCNVLRLVALRQGFYRPFPFCVWPKKIGNMAKLGFLQNPAFWHFKGVKTIFTFWLSSFNFQQRKRMWWQPAFLLWSKIWRGLELEMKGFQVCIWIGSILIRLDSHQIGDYTRGSRVIWTWSIKVKI